MGIEEKVAELLQLTAALPRRAPQNLLGDFNRGEIFILKYLNANDGTACPSKMSDAMQTSTARIAAALRGLEHKGWITREPDENDRRKKLVHLTPEGAEYIKNLQEKLFRNITKLLMELGEEDATEYIRITKKMVAIAQNFEFDC
jgi:Transcriptional regulators